MNLARILEYSASFFPNRPAVLDADREISYDALNRESNLIATALTDLGIKAGDDVAICAPNSLQWLAFYFGALKIGAVAVTISSALTRHELTWVLDNARPKVLLTVDERVNDLAEVRDRGYLRHVIHPQGDISYDKLLQMGSPRFSGIDLDRTHTAAVLYTGGTTGTPKGVMLTHENLITSAHNVSHFERSTPEDRALCFLPLNHVFGQIHITLATVYSSACLILHPSFDLEKILHSIQREHVTKFFAVPTIYVRLLAQANPESTFASVRYCFSAAASMAAELVREWKARTALDIHESYGLTESASMVTYNHYHRHVIGSVGTPINTVEVQIRDKDGNALATGSEGEICIRGPNIMKGYLRNQDETAAALAGNWFRSGDIGALDDDGYLYIVDRIKDLIITGGENVYPREIEEALYERPEIQECTVFGLPDREWGEKVVAVVVPKGEERVEISPLRAYLKSRLAPFKVPKEILSMAELPKSSTGKILKRQVRKELLNGNR